MLLSKRRLAVQQSPAFRTPPTAVRVPYLWVAISLASLLCLSLHMTSTSLLVASAQHEGGRVVACRYFTGTHMVERQHSVVASGADRHVSCPLIRVR